MPAGARRMRMLHDAGTRPDSAMPARAAIVPPTVPVPAERVDSARPGD